MAHQILEPGRIADYHAHVYYDAGSRAAAAQLREALECRFEVTMGRWRDAPVGPHPRSMYQVKFNPDQFARILPWLMLNRGGLTILIHPNTGNAYEDHTEHALWLGGKLDLRLNVLREGRLTLWRRAARFNKKLLPRP
jgi:aromatic ring-cleaving dioxygenase